LSVASDSCNVDLSVSNSCSHLSVPGFEVIFRRYCDANGSALTPGAAFAAAGNSHLLTASESGDCLVSLLHDLSSVLRTNGRFLRRAAALHVSSTAPNDVRSSSSIRGGMQIV